MSLITNNTDLQPPLKKQKLEVEIGSDPVRTLPEEIIIKIFSFQEARGLVACSLVSRDWKRLAYDPSFWHLDLLKETHPHIGVIDGRAWKEYVNLKALNISLEDEPQSDIRKEILGVQKKLHSLPEVEGEDWIPDFIRLTIPKGHSLNKLAELCSSDANGKLLIKGNPSRIWSILHHVKKELGDKEVEKTRIIYITTNVFKGSTNKSLENQKEFLNACGMKLVETLPVATLAILGNVMADEDRLLPFLYGEYREDGEFPPFTRTSDMIGGKNVMVGGHSREGLYINNSDSSPCYLDGVGGYIEVEDLIK